MSKTEGKSNHNICLVFLLVASSQKRWRSGAPSVATGRRFLGLNKIARLLQLGL
jgi:hypothetical protein